MKLIGNLLWIVFGGLLSSLAFLIVGIIWCITLVGIPIGVHCFKFAGLSLVPFGKEIEYGGGVGASIINILWLIFGGLELAAAFLIAGAVFCVTVIGIPFGLQYFKFAKLSLLPFGAKVVDK